MIDRSETQRGYHAVAELWKESNCKHMQCSRKAFFGEGSEESKILVDSVTIQSTTEAKSQPDHTCGAESSIIATKLPAYD